VAAIALVLGAFKAGWLATRQEVDATRREVETVKAAATIAAGAAQQAAAASIDAWKGRSEYTERQLDAALANSRTLTQALKERTNGGHLS